MKPINTTTLSNKIKSLLEDTMPGVGASETDNEDTKSVEDPEECDEDDEDCEEDQLTAPENQSDEEVVITDTSDDEEADVEESTPDTRKSADTVLGILDKFDDGMSSKLAKLIAFSLQLSPNEQKKLLQGCKRHL